jgi:hypothetical protein
VPPEPWPTHASGAVFVVSTVGSGPVMRLAAEVCIYITLLGGCRYLACELPVTVLWRNQDGIPTPSKVTRPLAPIRNWC